MANPAPAVSDLRPSELVAKLGMSRSYASELVKRKKTPSLEMAVRIEREFGVPLTAWIAAGDLAGGGGGEGLNGMSGDGACDRKPSPGINPEVSGEA